MQQTESVGSAVAVGEAGREGGVKELEAVEDEGDDGRTERRRGELLAAQSQSKRESAGGPGPKQTATAEEGRAGHCLSESLGYNVSSDPARSRRRHLRGRAEPCQCARTATERGKHGSPVSPGAARSCVAPARLVEGDDVVRQNRNTYSIGAYAFYYHLTGIIESSGS